MNVKIMLNKDEEIKELAKDPEVQVKIKAAIIDGIGKRSINAVQKELGIDIDRAVYKEIYQGITGRLKDSVKELLRNGAEEAVHQAITSSLSDIMVKEFYSIVRKRLDALLEEINHIDLRSIVEKKAAEILERKLGR